MPWMLKQQEAQFLRQEEEEQQRIRHEQQQEMLRQQTKAWTMPDDDEEIPAVEEAAPVQAVAEAPVVEPETPQVFSPDEEPGGGSGGRTGCGVPGG